MKTILSLGVGVNSVALLVLKAQGVIDFDEAVFADTGAEQPETYEYWSHVVVPFCFDNGINLARINREGKTLPEHCFEKRIIPSRMFRWCTDKWKIRVQRSYALRKYGKEDKVNFLIGYAADEKERADNCVLSGKYPLIELGLDREGCKRVIRSVEFSHNKPAGLPVPVKSGCWCCPYQPEESLIRLYKKHPDLYAKLEEMEKNNLRYPEMLLAFPAIGRLESLRRKLEANTGYEVEKRTTQRLLFCPMCEFLDEAGEVDYTGYENFHLQVKPISQVSCVQFDANKEAKQ